MDSGANERTASIRDLAGVVQSPRPVGVEEMNEAVAAEAAETCGENS